MQKTITVVLEIDSADRSPCASDISCDDDLQSVFDDSDIDLMQGLKILVTNFHEGDKLSEKPQHFSDRELAERGLPPFAWAVDGSTGKTIKIERGMMGYFPVVGTVDAKATNTFHSITEAQAEAMLMGSMFGWHVPGAYPKK